MSGIQVGQQFDMNNNKITELAPGTAGTDAVNVDQLNAAISPGYAQTIGDGTNTSYTITHNFGTNDVMIQVYEIATAHNVLVDAFRATSNSVTVAFGAAIATNSHRVLVLPVIP